MLEEVVVVVEELQGSAVVEGVEVVKAGVDYWSPKDQKGRREAPVVADPRSDQV